MKIIYGGWLEEIQRKQVLINSRLKAILIKRQKHSADKEF